jgi:hypothetical protein
MQKIYQRQGRVTELKKNFPVSILQSLVTYEVERSGGQNPLLFKHFGRL